MIIIKLIATVIKNYNYKNSKGNIQKNTPPEEEEEIYIHESVDLYNHQLFLMI